LRLPAVLVAHGVTTSAMQADDYPPAAAQRLRDSLVAVEHIVAVAHHLAADLARLGAARLTMISNVVDAAVFAPRPAAAALRRELAIDGDAPVVGHASNLTDHKRAADLIAALPHLLAAQPRAVVLIIGDGAERANLLQQVDAAGVRASVRFLGAVAHARMPELLNLCDVVVMPSLRETASLLYRETQACGRVLLSSDIAAAREAVVDGETGVLFPCGDRAALAAQLISLLGDAPRRRRIGAAARAAAQALDHDAWVCAYADVLQRVVRRLPA
jgi:phosphatidylinositol alpha-1,6-mannosyltransferase